MALLELVLAAGLMQATTTISPPGLGLQLDVPKDWKSVQRKGAMQLLLPPTLGGGRIEIFSANFKKEPETWQAIEAAMAAQLKREVVRQWQEELLGVPLLLTHTRWRAGEANQEALSGLLYAWTPRKMLFRLQTSEAGFPDAVVAWRQALSTLRTTDGRLPVAEDPNKPWDPAELQKPITPAPKTRLEPPKSGNRPAELAPVAVDTTVAGRAAVLRIPTGWMAEKAGDFEWSLRHPELPFPIRVGVFSTLDSPAPERTLLRASSESLGRFARVDRRNEPKPETNKAGALVRQVWRFGQGDAGPLWTLEAVGSKDRLYWLASAQGEGAIPAGVQRLIASLLQSMSLEPTNP
ncbi:MAG: hypothetical protein LDL56_03105 [Armatimonadetes bacterium]|nr:hypothetical protein [Armatimonadota bacterium]